MYNVTTTRRGMSKVIMAKEKEYKALYPSSDNERKLTWQWGSVWRLA